MLDGWRNVVRAAVGTFVLGLPMHVVSEDMALNATRNPAFELAYWRFGFEHAGVWMKRLGEEPPEV